MAATSPAKDALNTLKRRRGRPPLLAKSTLNCGSLDRFLKPGSTSSASTSTSSASVMVEVELPSSENQNPNVAPCHVLNSISPYSSSGTGACSSKIEGNTLCVADELSRDHTLKNPSSENMNTVLVTAFHSHDIQNLDHVPPPMHSSLENLNPLPNNPESVPAVASVNQLPKKAGRGRPRKTENAKPDLPITSLPLSKDELSMDQTQAVLSSEIMNTVPVNVFLSHDIQNLDHNPPPMYSTIENLNPLPNNPESVPAVVSVNQVPKKAGRGRPHKVENAKLDLPIISLPVSTDELSKDQTQTHLSSENMNTVPVNEVLSHDIQYFDQNLPPMHSTLENLNPLPNNPESAPAVASVNQVPKKAGRGRPRKAENTKPDLPITSLPLSKDVPVQSALNDTPTMAKKGAKRKRSIVTGPLDAETRDCLLKEFKSEMASLIRFYNEDGKIDLTMVDVKNAGRRVEIALLLEESSLPFSSLIANLLLQLKPMDDGQGGSDLTPASLRSIVLSIGERISFGTPNPDADILEDDSEACLWCWEVRDIKLIPQAFRNVITNRRRKRRKIAERIVALSGILTAITATIGQDQDKLMFEKAEDLLRKTENEEQIRALVSHWQQKIRAKLAVQSEKVEEKETPKEQYKNALETEKEKKRLEKEEKEKKRLEREEEKKKLQQEKERDRLDKERERLEREASKQRSKEALKQEKEMKRQQEEAEKEQKRKEKEEADLRRQSELKKQANIMGRFLQTKKDQAESVSCLPDHKEVVLEAANVSPLHQKLIQDMDHEMLHGDAKSSHNFLNSHLLSWKKLSSLSRRVKRWGQRRLPKRTPVNELRLQSQSIASEGADEEQSGLGAATAGGCKRSRSEYEEHGHTVTNSEPEWDDAGLMEFSSLIEQDLVAEPRKSLQFQNKRRKLLQFAKSYRPAYYGSFSKQSDAVRPRNPLGQDANLDYEIDSDEEWEEEDPGESLSDCEKDEEDEKPDLDEDEEAGDGFLVPDGYLSESEGAHVEESDSENDAEQLQNEIYERVNTASQSGGNQSLFKFARQRKALEHLTDHALRCNRPYIICNFNQFKSSTTVQTMDRHCLEALRVCPLASRIQIEVPEDPQLKKIDDGNKQPIKQRTKKSLPETSLREMVEILLPSTCGLKRLVGLLSAKIPTASRALLKDKVKEVADFVDNHWQVKKEILDQLGISPPCLQATSNPEPVSKSPPQLKPITKFFSKRCLPPETAGLEDTSPMKGKVSYGGKSDMAVCGDTHLDEPVQSDALQLF